MKIGFIGLGRMGAAIAETLLRAGHDVTVWNRSPEPVAALVEKGAHEATTPEKALAGDALLSMLASDATMRAVGLDGAALDHAAPGLVHANLATISTSFVRELTQAHAERGLGYVAAPVFGRPDAAAARQLIVVAGGAASAIQKLEPVFSAIGRRTVMAGDTPEKANLFKITGNFLIAAALESMGEAFALLRKGGVDAKLFHDVLANSLFAAPVYQNYGSIILAEKYEPAGFQLALGLKDVDLARAAAGELKVPMAVGEILHEHYTDAVKTGWGDKDWSALASFIAAKAGL